MQGKSLYQREVATDYLFVYSFIYLFLNFVLSTLPYRCQSSSVAAAQWFTLNAHRMKDANAAMTLLEK